MKSILAPIQCMGLWAKEGCETKAFSVVTHTVMVPIQAYWSDKEVPACSFFKRSALLKMCFYAPSVLRKKVPRKPSHISEVLPLHCALRQGHMQPRKAGLSSAGPSGKPLFQKPLLFLAQNLESPPSTGRHTSHLGNVPSPLNIHRKSNDSLLKSVPGFQASRVWLQINFSCIRNISSKPQVLLLLLIIPDGHLDYFPAACTDFTHSPKSTSPSP